MIFPRQRLVMLACAPALLCVLCLWLPPLTAFAWLALCALCAIAGLDARALWRTPSPAVRRELPERARLHEACPVRHRLENRARTSIEAELLDELALELGGDLCHGPVRIAAGEESTLDALREPSRRGILALGPCYVMQHSPLGLWLRREACALGQELRVYPARTREQSPLSNQDFDQLGIAKKRPRGAGSEFESLREYSIGDEPRHIDWRASARSRRVMVRTFHTERNHTVVVALDCGRLMAGRVDGASKLDHALSAALNLIRVSTRNGDRVGFVAFHRELCAFVSPQRPERVLGPVLEASLQLQPKACEPSYRVLSEALAQRQKKRALLVILTDFVEGESTHELQAYLSALGKRHCVLLVGLRDRLLRSLEEPAPDITGMDVFKRLVLQDLEIGRQAALLRMSRLGVHTLDLDPAHITAPLLSRYLQIRQAGLL